ncbi:molybdopterin-dependent oxidoreductase [Actinomadura sp. ATCC 31491]|uniref:Molybdopterin-dependent oxidoreductase n=1 Tax=Actinomadura luzonensis TaxID=2805427 RepID=A0ABT0G766_9ACTN|nr:molybdopterin-dependent oxidoreductase [Actinomadura luzonensis]MCK2220364.1 molybdopterin-dependent oxidoreductase [Actinomadura luzonensis]
MTDRHDPARGGPPLARRVLLATLGAGAAALAAAPVLRGGWESAVAAISRNDPTGLSGLLPGPGGFRYFSVAGSVPERTAADYRLEIGGLVERPRAYTLADLRALPQTRVVGDVTCTDGWQVPGAAFSGVLLSHLLDRAGVRAQGGAVRFTCFDGVYSESLTLDQARRPDVLVALDLMDAPLGHDRGGPVRLYVAPMYFYKSAKWLSGITVTEQVVPGYWEEYGYDVDGWLDRRA